MTQLSIFDQQKQPINLSQEYPEGINVLSPFDGMSCGQIALERAGIKVKNYYASEIDKYAIQITQKNYPNTIQIGDVMKAKGTDLPEIHLIIGGSPCQGFSFAGKGLDFDDPRSKLFFEYVRLLRELEPTYFLLENVKMKKKSEAVISEYLGVEPVKINSDLVSAQNRNRLYWSNIPNISQPKDKQLSFGDIREYGVADNFYYGERAMAWINRHSERTGKELRIWDDKTKVQMLEATMHKKYSSQRFFGIPEGEVLRYITPLECERAQTVPDNYTEGVSNTQRYRMLGNGWTVDVIAHIFSYLNQA